MAILTNIDNLEKFLKNEIVLNYLKSVDKIDSNDRKRIFTLPIGSFEKYDLGSGIFALEQSYITKDRSECFWETHRKYIDIQVHLDGIEQMEYVDFSKLKVKLDYNETKDLIVYEDIKDSNKIVMQPNDIAIYFPNDAHMGLPMYENQVSRVFKTVIKFPLELWK